MAPKKSKTSKGPGSGREPSTSGPSPSAPAQSPSKKRKSPNELSAEAEKRRKLRERYCDEALGRRDYTTTKQECDKRLARTVNSVGLEQTIDIHEESSLTLTEMALAILSVTEAISAKGAAKFCLYDAIACEHASQGQDESFDTYRNEHPILMPWVTKDKYGSEHSILCYARPWKDGKESGVDVTVYDSSPGQKEPEEKQRIVQNIALHLKTKSKWFRPGDKGYTAAWKDTEKYTVSQRGSTTSGFHVVLNAWIIALGLETTREYRNEAAKSQVHYERIAKVVRSAIHGAASFDYIFAALACLGYVDVFATVEDNRKFEWTVATHSGEWLREISLPVSIMGSEYKKHKKDEGKGSKSGGKEPNIPHALPQQRARISAKAPQSSQIVDTEPSIDASKDPCKYFVSNLKCNISMAQTLATAVDMEVIQIPHNKDLEDTQIILAILSVTEAISQHAGEVKFGIYDATAWTQIAQAIVAGNVNWAMLRKQGSPTSFDLHRRNRTILMPWGTFREQRLTSREVDASGRQVTTRGFTGHHVLVVASREGVGGSERYYVKVYDSSPPSLHNQHGKFQDQVREMLDTSWSDSANNNWEFECVDVMWQMSETGCGIHTILNAWTVALGLEPPGQINFDTRKRNSFYKTAALLISCAVHGAAQLDTIMAFFRCFGFIRNPAAEIEPDRRFETTIGIGTDNELTAHVKGFRRKSEEKAKGKQAGANDGERNNIPAVDGRVDSTDAPSVPPGSLSSEVDNPEGQPTSIPPLDPSLSSNPPSGCPCGRPSGPPPPGPNPSRSPSGSPPLSTSGELYSDLGLDSEEPNCAHCPAPGHCSTPPADVDDDDDNSNTNQHLRDKVTGTPSVSQPWATKKLKGQAYDPADTGAQLRKWLDKKNRLASKSGLYPKASAVPRRLPHDRRLTNSEIVRAIAAVTEAISLHEGRTKTFGLYGVRAYENAKAEEEEEDEEDARGEGDFILGGRDEVFLPLATDHWKRVERENCDIRLLQVRRGRTENGEEVITVDFWGDHESIDDGLTRKDRDQLQHDAERLIDRLRWWTGPSPDDGEEPPPPPRFAHRWNQTRRRISKAASGIHVVLDAWSLALGLRPANTQDDPPSYEDAAELITNTLHGCMSAELLLAHLRAFGWVVEAAGCPAQLDESRNFKSACAFTDDGALQQHVLEMFPQMYPDVSGDGPPPGSKSKKEGKGKGSQKRKKNNELIATTCIHCPVRNHCHKPGDRLPGDKREERGWTPALWPSILKDHPCPFFMHRVKSLRAYQEQDALRDGYLKVIQDFDPDKEWSLSALIRAIASVTEAISMNGYTPRGPSNHDHENKVLFALYDPAHLRAALSANGAAAAAAAHNPPLRFQRLDKDNPRGRYGSPILLPLAHDHLVVAAPRATAATQQQHRRGREMRRPEITHYVLEDPLYPGMPIGEERERRERDAERALRNMRWFKGPYEPPPQQQQQSSADVNRAYHHTWRPVAPVLSLPETRIAHGEEEGYEEDARVRYRAHASLHTIINAWVVAFGFQPPAAGLRLAEYKDLWDVVVLACQGLVDAATVFALLRCVGWIQDEGGLVAGAADVPEARRFDETARFVEDADLERHREWVKERLDVVEAFRPTTKEVGARRAREVKREAWLAKKQDQAEKEQEAGRREAEHPYAEETKAARERADAAGTEASLACLAYQEASAKFKGPPEKVLVAHRELLRTPCCGPAFLGLLSKSNAEDRRTGYWEGPDGQCEAIRTDEVGMKFEKARKEFDSVLGKRKREKTRFVVDRGSEVYGAMLKRHKGEGLQRIVRKDLAKLFKNPPQDPNAPNVGKEMVDAAERYFLAYEKV